MSIYMKKTAVMIFAAALLSGCAESAETAYSSDTAAVSAEVTDAYDAETVTSAVTEAVTETEASETTEVITETDVSEKTEIQTEMTDAVTAAEETVTEVTIQQPQTTEPTEQTDVPETEVMPYEGNGIDKLTSDLVSNLWDKEENVCISGFSAYSALAMIYPYLSQNEAAQIDSVIGTIDSDKVSEMSFPNTERGALFAVDNSLKLNTDKTDNFYFADLHTQEFVDYTNSFVADKTHDMIRDILSSPPSGDVRSIIIDTLYFKAEWRYKFIGDFNTTEEFEGVNGVSQTEFMNMDGVRLEYTNEVKGCGGVIELPYDSGDVSMYILKDVESSKSLENFLEAMDKDTIVWQQPKVNLKLPKFENDGTYELTDILADMGISDIFTEGDRISGLADDLYVSRILQKTKIRVDNDGTEAAAATMIMTMNSCAPSEPEPIIDFFVRKPFIYVIRDNSSGTVLFAGFRKSF